MKLNTESFFIDMDGTSLDIKKKVNNKYLYFMSQKNKDAIKEAQKHAQVFFSSGGYANVVPLMKELNMPYAVLYNGALIIDKEGNKVYERKLDDDISKAIIEYCTKKKMIIKLDDDKTCYGSRGIYTLGAKLKGYTAIKSYAVPRSTDIYKFVVFGKRKRGLERFRRKLERELNKKWPNQLSLVISSGGRIIEVTHKEAIKGLADVRVCKMMGINPKKSVHIGDSMNDATAIGKIGRVIAMKNSNKKFKKKASSVGPHYKKNGLALLLAKLIKE